MKVYVVIRSENERYRTVESVLRTETTSVALVVAHLFRVRFDRSCRRLALPWHASFALPKEA